jgi:glycosyltransferase involved in cell wall biosynthesis
MQLGCPVITSNAGSLREVCGDAAMYVNPYEVASIKQAIEEIATNDNLAKECSVKGLKQASIYSKAQYRVRVLAGYERLLGAI